MGCSAQYEPLPPSEESETLQPNGTCVNDYKLKRQAIWIKILLLFALVESFGLIGLGVALSKTRGRLQTCGQLVYCETFLTCAFLL